MRKQEITQHVIGIVLVIITVVFVCIYAFYPRREVAIPDEIKAATEWEPISLTKEAHSNLLTFLHGTEQEHMEEEPVGMNKTHYKTLNVSDLLTILKTAKETDAYPLVPDSLRELFKIRFPGRKPDQLIVLGMHHSATSIMTRLIMFLGPWAGEIQDIALLKRNPLKFWERRDVINLNQELFNIHGVIKEPAWSGYHFDLLKLVDRDPEYIFGNWTPRAKRIIDEKLNKVKRPWVTKEPRMCITAPLWESLLDNSACIIIYRHPVPVARGLLRYEGLNFIEWLDVWYAYTIGILDFCQNKPTAIVSQDVLIEDPYFAIYKLWKDLERLGTPKLREPSREDVLEFLSTPAERPPTPTPEEIAALSKIPNLPRLLSVWDQWENTGFFDWDKVTPLLPNQTESIQKKRERWNNREHEARRQK